MRGLNSTKTARKSTSSMAITTQWLRRYSMTFIKKYSGYGRPFQLGNKLNLHVIDALNGDIKQALDNDSVIKLNENRVEILITKTRGGRLQPLLVYRVRVHAPLMELKDSTMLLLKNENWNLEGLNLSSTPKTNWVSASVSSAFERASPLWISKS